MFWFQKAFDALDKFEEDYKARRGRGRETLRTKTNVVTTLQSINEDEGEFIYYVNNNNLMFNY